MRLKFLSYLYWLDKIVSPLNRINKKLAFLVKMIVFCFVGYLLGILGYIVSPIVAIIVIYLYLYWLFFSIFIEIIEEDEKDEGENNSEKVESR